MTTTIRGHAKSFVALFALASGTAFVVAACSADRETFRDGDQPIALPDAAVPDAKACGFRCSRDLKKVLKGCEGEDEQVVAACPPDQGCGVDKCVDACSAAVTSKGSVGCSFYTLPPDDAKYGLGACFAAMIANTWDRPVTVKAQYGGAPLDISRSIYTVSRTSGDPVYTKLEGALPIGEVGVVFLAQAKVLLDPDATPCPVGTVPALDVDPLRHGTTKAKAFQLETDAPVAAYSIFPYGGAASFYPSSTLLLPVSSWEKSYVAVSTGLFGDVSASSLNRRTIQIVANEDDTVVSMRPNVDVAPGEDVAAALAGKTTSWTLARGQVLQISQLSSTTGSPISATKPIGLFGGSPCTFLPAEKGFCDLTQQQIAPFSQWGNDYALVPYRSRLEGVSGDIIPETVPWSITAAVDGTRLTYDPARPPGAPEKLDAGQSVTFLTDAITSVRSQDTKHPFHAALHMTGSSWGGGGGGRVSGDPEFVNAVPSAQFLDRYVFFTDYTFPETTLTFVRRKTAKGFEPVTLACSGEVTGWKPLGKSGEYEYAWMRVTSGYVPQVFAKGTCGYGRHEAESEGPFSITVWGTGKDASYGYVGGAGSRPVNDAPLPTVQ